MSTTTYFERQHSLDYRYMGGVVGTYQGQDVFVVPEKDFSIKRSRGDRKMIFAVSTQNPEGLGRKPGSLLLVSSGSVIGEMSPDGEVELYERSYEWKGRGWKQPDPEVEASTEVEVGGRKNYPVPEVIYTSGKSVDDFLAGETLADRFLREASTW